MSDDPEINVAEVGAFDPVNAWLTTMDNLYNLMSAVRTAPDALPPAEILLATQLACDTLEAITELTVMSLGGEIASVLPDEAVDAHNARDEAMREERTEAETTMWKIELIRGVTNFVPAPPKE